MMLSALTWRAILTARLPKLEPGLSSTLVRAVNSRRFYRRSFQTAIWAVGNFPLPPLSDLAQNLSITDITAFIRKEVNEIDDYHVRSFASFVKSELDKENITFSSPSPDTDMTISSWASLPIYPCDSGLRLGKPEFVRRPTFGYCDGLVFIMPKNLAGELDVAISLKEDDLQRLKSDAAWTTYADLIG